MNKSVLESASIPLPDVHTDRCVNDSSGNMSRTNSCRGNDMTWGEVPAIKSEHAFKVARRFANWYKKVCMHHGNMKPHRCIDVEAVTTTQ